MYGRIYFEQGDHDLHLCERPVENHAIDERTNVFLGKIE